VVGCRSRRAVGQWWARLPRRSMSWWIAHARTSGLIRRTRSWWRWAIRGPTGRCVSLDTTNRYAEINTNTELAALRATELLDVSTGHQTKPICRTDETLLNWLSSL
jgi:hypothetical protein